MVLICPASEDEFELPLPSRNDLYSIEKEQRWYFCTEARELIRYDSEWSGGYRVGQPRLHKFKYFSGLEEFYHAFSCATKPAIYLRASHSDPRNVLTITLEVDSRLEKNERPWTSYE